MSCSVVSCSVEKICVCVQEQEELIKQHEVEGAKLDLRAGVVHKKVQHIALHYTTLHYITPHDTTPRCKGILNSPPGQTV